MFARCFASMMVLCFPCLAAAACPRPFSEAQLHTFAQSGQEVAGYVMLRWFKCGWDATVPVIAPAAQITREAADAKADPDDQSNPLQGDELVEMLSMTVFANPNDAPRVFAMGEDEPDEDDPPALAELMRLRVSSAEIVHNMENGVTPAIAWLRHNYLLPAELDLRLELALIAHKVRSGDLASARAQLALAAPRAAQALVLESDGIPEWASMQAVLAEPVVQSATATGPGIMIDRATEKRSYRETQCGFIGKYERLDFTDLRAYVLRAAPIDLAIGELLGQWREPVGADGGEHLGLLVELLKKRYAQHELEQAFSDAIATLRNDDQVAGMNLFSHFVVLPSSVREDDATAPGGVRERRLEEYELADIVRGTALYRALLSTPIGIPPAT